MEPDLEAMEALIGHAFQDRELLRRALTHKSLAYEQAATGGDNERLEFLGDAVLGFLASEALLQAYPDSPEGKLSKFKAHLVSASNLHAAARRLDLGRHLLLGHGEELSGGRLKKNLLSDALEALIAAVYLDGGLEAARSFVLRHVLEGLAVLEDAPDAPGRDHKSALQELAQERRLPPPHYRVVTEQGPEHSKTFTVEVRVGQDWAARAEGLSKKSAAQRAAKLVFEQLQSGTHPTNSVEE